MATNPSTYAWTQPVDEVSTSKYPYNNATQTESGHTMEFDDTPGAERIRLQHRANSYIEMRSDGDGVVSFAGNGYEIVAKDKNVYIKGICNITVEGDSVLEVKGDCKQRIKGNFTQLVEGDYTVVTNGKANISSVGNMNIGILSGASGKVKLLAGESFIVNSDLIVNGTMLADSITSTGDLSCGNGLQVGLPGSLNPVAGISTIGGINVGVPPASPTVPGIVNAAVAVTAPSVIATVISYSPIVMDNVGGLPFMRLSHDTHFHAGVHGPTSVPTVQMPLP